MTNNNNNYILNIKDCTHNLIENNENDLFKLEILNDFFLNKINYLFEKECNKIKKKKKDELQINIESEKILKLFKNIYYNQFLNFFYHYDKNTLKIINYDSIIVKMNLKLDQKNLLQYKNKINNNIKNSLKKKIFLDIIPDENDIKIIDGIFKDIFINNDILKYFLYFIGSCLNNQEYNLFNGNIIFFGNYAAELIEILKYYIYDITKLYIRSLSDIKFRYNNYILKTSILFNISINDFQQLKNDLKKNKELFMIVCNYYFKNNSFIENNCNLHHMFYLNKFNSKFDFFSFYLNKNTELNENEELKIVDVYTDLNNFLISEKLPSNLITNKDINQFMHDHFDNCFKKKNVYKLKLLNHNKQDIFDLFYKNHIIQEENNTVSINQIEFFFKKWYRSENFRYSCLSKFEIKKYISLKNDIIFKDNQYLNIKILNFDKKEIYSKYCIENLIESENSIICLLDIKNNFDIWFNKNYNNYPELSLNETKYYLYLFLHNYDELKFGWCGYKVKD